MKEYNEVETAKLVKQTLKRYFPKTKFSVRTDKYSMGSSIRVSWTDGPTNAQVEQIAGKFHGADFDGMQDLKYYTGAPYGNDYIFFNRNYSAKMGDVLLRDADLTNNQIPTLKDLIPAAFHYLNKFGRAKSYMIAKDGKSGEVEASGPSYDINYIYDAFEALGFKAMLSGGDRWAVLINQ